VSDSILSHKKIALQIPPEVSRFLQRMARHIENDDCGHCRNILNNANGNNSDNKGKGEERVGNHPTPIAESRRTYPTTVPKPTKRRLNV
jgi:hypothetical protein